MIRADRWDNPRSGVFKRFMTVSSQLILPITPLKFDRTAQYTYILSLPTLATFAIGNAAIKYKEGFIYFPGQGSEYHTCSGTANEPTHPVRPSSYPETIPAVGEATFRLDFPAYDGPVLRMGIGNVSTIACQTHPD